MGMTTSTTKDNSPETKAVAAIDAPSALQPQPELVVPRASSGPDLESRIKQRRADLIGKLGEVRAGVGLEVVEARDKLKARLSELAHILKEGVVDGWASLGDAVTHKLERWLSESERSVAGHGLPPKNARS